MAKQKNWNLAQSNVCVKNFNLFESSEGAEGWDPRQTLKADVVENLKTDSETRKYLSKSDGGHKSNNDNAKALRGYRRVASEFWVSIAKRKIRKSKICFVRQLTHPLLTFLFLLLF
jgi:hypothetical protein